MLTSHFEDYIHKDKKSLSLFRHRGAQYVDVIILLDWNTSSKTLTSDNHLNILRKILEDWDPGIKYKKITILNGGYAEWLTRYPAFTTNPNVTEPTSSNVPDEILDSIEYPEWIHLDEEENVKIRDSKTNPKGANKENVTYKSKVSKEEIWAERMDTEGDNVSMKSNNLTNSIVDVDKIPKSSPILRQYDNNSLKLQHRRSLSITKKNDVSAKPTVDRSNKPVSLNTSTLESRAVLKLMRQLNELAKSKQVLEEEILEEERALYMQDGTKHKSSNEEEYIRGNLKSLYLKLEEKVRNIDR